MGVIVSAAYECTSCEKKVSVNKEGGVWFIGSDNHGREVVVSDESLRRKPTLPVNWMEVQDGDYLCSDHDFHYTRHKPKGKTESFFSVPSLRELDNV